MEMLLVLILCTCRILALVLGYETKGIWTQILHRNCSCICELDVRLLNHPNWTPKAQVMVHVLGLPQLRLSLSLCPYFGTVLCPGFGIFVWLVMAVCVDCL